ncbi:unnamed protein product [Caretta caretta]
MAMMRTGRKPTMAMTKKLMMKIRMATEREPAIAVESRTVATRVYDGDGANDGNKDCSGAEEGGDEGGNGGQDGIDMGGEESMTGITRKLMTVVEPRMATRPKPAVTRKPMMVAEPGTTVTIRESVMATEPRMEATRKVNELMMVAVKRSVDGADSKANGTQDDGDQEADDACDSGIAQVSNDGDQGFNSSNRAQDRGDEGAMMVEPRTVMKMMAECWVAPKKVMELARDLIAMELMTVMR